MKNPIAWVEVPVVDMSRAIKFYNKTFSWNIEPMDMGELIMALFPGQPDYPGAWGALVYHADAYAPASDHTGCVVYFACENINTILQNVESAGGKVLMPKKLISPDNGSMALFEDSEGNRMALHSNETN